MGKCIDVIIFFLCLVIYFISSQLDGWENCSCFTQRKIINLIEEKRNEEKVESKKKKLCLD